MQRNCVAKAKPFKVVILAPKETPVGAEVTANVTLIQRDWKAATKLAMVEDANNFLTKAHKIELLNPDLLAALRSTIEEEPLPMYSIGEFFILYGRFEQKYGLSKPKETRKKMEELLKERKGHLKEYDKNKKHPLPLHCQKHFSTHRNESEYTPREGAGSR